MQWKYFSAIQFFSHFLKTCSKKIIDDDLAKISRAFFLNLRDLFLSMSKKESLVHSTYIYKNNVFTKYMWPFSCVKQNVNIYILVIIYFQSEIILFTTWIMFNLPSFRSTENISEISKETNLEKNTYKCVKCITLQHCLNKKDTQRDRRFVDIKT